MDYKESETRTYDAAGNETAYVDEFFNGQGELTNEYTREAGFDDDGNLLFEESVEHFVGIQKIIHRDDYQYDTDGKLREAFSEQRTAEDDGSYRVKWRYAYYYSYDEQGRITRRVWEFDRDGDDTIDSVKTGTFAYNEQGAMVSERYESDESNDGIADSVGLITYDYQTLEQGVMHLIWLEVD